MNVVLWVLQIVLAAIFAIAGILKATQPKEKLVANLPWVEDFSLGTVRFIGVVEMLAATGLVIQMALAANTHRRRHEPAAIALTLVLLVAALVVAWGRFGPYAF